MAQQTAVDWLLENIQKVHKMDWDIVFIQAKQMEKEQIIKARMVGDYFCDTTNCEQYYNEIYGNNSNVNL
jgi:hypothetical protein